VTRPASQASGLRSLLAEQGAEVICQPAIEIGPPPDWTPVDRVLASLDQFDWVVFSSSNGVQFFLDRAKKLGHPLAASGRVRLAAIGTGTADELARYQLVADRVPAKFRAESLADSLQDEAARAARFLLVRASRGRETLAARLTAAGGAVTQVVAYASVDTPAADPQVMAEMAAGQIDWVTVTSSAIARSLVWRRAVQDPAGEYQPAHVRHAPPVGLRTRGRGGDLHHAGGGGSDLPRPLTADGPTADRSAGNRSRVAA
jgi:uroporphyrinogen III methyltransferase/synthase